MNQPISRTELLKAWVKALRSGKYQQRKQYLNRDGKFCCVGVACEVAIAHGVPIEKRTESGSYENIVRYDSMCGSAPHHLGLVLRGINWGQLYDMNDFEERSFDQIADFIEKTYIPQGAS